MYDIAIDPKPHDILFYQGDNGLYDVLFIDSAERVAQQIGIALQTQLGEWLLDTRAGVPYREYIFVRNPNFRLINDLFRRAINEIAGVKYIKSLEFSHDLIKRKLYVNWTVVLDNDKKISNSEVIKYG